MNWSVLQFKFIVYFCLLTLICGAPTKQKPPSRDITNAPKSYDKDCKEELSLNGKNVAEKQRQGTFIGISQQLAIRKLKTQVNTKNDPVVSTSILHSENSNENNKTISNIDDTASINLEQNQDFTTEEYTENPVTSTGSSAIENNILSSEQSDSVNVDAIGGDTSKLILVKTNSTHKNSILKDLKSSTSALLKVVITIDKNTKITSTKKITNLKQITKIIHLKPINVSLFKVSSAKEAVTTTVKPKIKLMAKLMGSTTKAINKLKVAITQVPVKSITNDIKIITALPEMISQMSTITEGTEDIVDKMGEIMSEITPKTELQSMQTPVPQNTKTTAADTGTENSSNDNIETDSSSVNINTESSIESFITSLSIESTSKKINKIMPSIETSKKVAVTTPLYKTPVPNISKAISVSIIKTTIKNVPLLSTKLQVTFTTWKPTTVSVTTNKINTIKKIVDNVQITKATELMTQTPLVTQTDMTTTTLLPPKYTERDVIESTSSAATENTDTNSAKLEDPSPLPPSTTMKTTNYRTTPKPTVKKVADENILIDIAQLGTNVFGDILGNSNINKDKSAVDTVKMGTKLINEAMGVPSFVENAAQKAIESVSKNLMNIGMQSLFSGKKKSGLGLGSLMMGMIGNQQQPTVKTAVRTTASPIATQHEFSFDD